MSRRWSVCAGETESQRLAKDNSWLVCAAFGAIYGAPSCMEWAIAHFGVEDWRNDGNISMDHLSR
jgi:hypothetical protein